MIFKVKLKITVWKQKNAIWPPGGHFESDISENQQALDHGHKQYAYEVLNRNSKANLSYTLENMPPIHSPDSKKSNMAAILKVTLLIINRLLPIHISDVSVKLRFDIQSQTKVRVWKPKKQIWLPGSHFEGDITGN